MLILHGGKRSPFVRRVAIWLALQDRAFERRPVELFGADFERFRAHNPLSRVPVLTTPDGDLIETYAIIDYLETTAEPAYRLLPEPGPQRIACQQVIALAHAVAEKGVAFVYETERRPPDLVWPDWVTRLRSQLEEGLAALETQTPATAWFGGTHPNGADAAVVATVDFLGTVAGLTDPATMPRLLALSGRSRALPAFATTHPQA
ncbi:glutathione S-transferase family protein [Devosia beringensis]|uniref:glutathione S-transferase family protein n=1 Tax=Devosia beringensis TaxID=2657486 RepID=UPI00186B7584|nr:glutathione S-transferase family protein [Devosia beringensis]